MPAPTSHHKKTGGRKQTPNFKQPKPGGPVTLKNWKSRHKPTKNSNSVLKASGAPFHFYWGTGHKWDADENGCVDYRQHCKDMLSSPAKSYTGFSETGFSDTGFSDTGFSNTGFSDTGFSETDFSDTGFFLDWFFRYRFFRHWFFRHR